MRGRKPQPTALKLARNNPGRRPLNENEPVHGAMDTGCPDTLTDPVARAEWERVAGQLSETNQVTTVDRTTLIGYCLKYGQWVALEQEASRHPFIVRSPSGYPMPNPALGMANKVFGLMLKAAAELGITPSSRSRVSVQPVERADEFTAFQNKRAKMQRVK
jgi:P27 family predicted phage terminase small subunit